MAEETTPDLEGVQNFIKGQVEDYLKQQLPQQVQRYVPQQQQSVKTEQDQAKEQLKEIISPFIEPGLEQARFEGADAKDYVKFYTSSPESVEYQDEVEKAFEQLKQAGRPTARADILRYIQGRQFQEDPDKFVAKVSERRKQQLDRAAGAADMGQFSVERARSDPKWSSFDKLSIEEMEKALDGVVF